MTRLLGRLLTLDGQPLDWATLHRRNAEYWALQEVREVFEPSPRVCGSCAMKHHRRCGGKMARIPGNRNRWDMVECPCPDPTHREEPAR